VTPTNLKNLGLVYVYIVHTRTYSIGLAPSVQVLSPKSIQIAGKSVLQNVKKAIKNMKHFPCSCWVSLKKTTTVVFYPRIYKIWNRYVLYAPHLRTPNPGFNPEFTLHIFYVNPGLNPGLGVLRCGLRSSCENLCPHYYLLL
jgi:hypothetical protein